MPNATTDQLRAACAEKPVAIKVVRRVMMRQSGRSCEDDEYRRCACRCPGAPRAVITSQMNNVKWHGDQGILKWAEVASDVCMAHKQRMDMARARAGAGAGPTSVVHYDELVRFPMSAITSMYSD